jgi:hypothetical protein
MIFYKPLSASANQPSRSSVVCMTAAPSMTSTASVTIVGDDIRRNFSYSKEDQDRIKVINTVDLAPKGQRIRITEQGTYQNRYYGHRS